MYDLCKRVSVHTILTDALSRLSPRFDEPVMLNIPVEFFRKFGFVQNPPPLPPIPFSFLLVFRNVAKSLTRGSISNRRGRRKARPAIKYYVRLVKKCRYRSMLTRSRLEFPGPPIDLATQYARKKKKRRKSSDTFSPRICRRFNFISELEFCSVRD